MLQKLPIGKSTFRTLIEENYVYIDKTDIALRLINHGTYFFLARPRRFGKSLFLDTLRSIFDGDKELFKGLHIYDKYEFSKFPIIRISFNNGAGKTKEEYQQRVSEILKNNQDDLEISCDETLSIIGCFENLIRQAYKKYNKKVVILVDEYDKPILDNIEDTEVARVMRDELKSFYSVIKGADEYLKFVFITGVSKFSQVSLFSGLNNIEDITLHHNYSTICGYTQSDLEDKFKDHLVGADMKKMKEWYNGYKFLGEGVYNPFDVLLFISNNYKFDDYWFQTGTPTFLLKLIEKNHYYLPELEDIVRGSSMLNSFDVDYIELETLMWQSGYLTIKETSINYDDTPLYHLAIPNKEVKISFMRTVADLITKIGSSASTRIKGNIYKAFLEKDFEAIEKTFIALYASIAYNNFTGIKLYEYEGYYASVFYAYLKSLGVEIIAEDVTNKGRIDLTIKFPNAIFVIEFKVDGTNSALQQIKDKDYPQQYIDDGRPIFMIGIEFDKVDRNISLFEFEEYLV